MLCGVRRCSSTKFLNKFQFCGVRFGVRVGVRVPKNMKNTKNTVDILTFMTIWQQFAICVNITLVNFYELRTDSGMNETSHFISYSIVRTCNLSLPFNSPLLHCTTPWDAPCVQLLGLRISNIICFPSGTFSSARRNWLRMIPCSINHLLLLCVSVGVTMNCSQREIQTHRMMNELGGQASILRFDQSAPIITELSKNWLWVKWVTLYTVQCAP